MSKIIMLKNPSQLLKTHIIFTYVFIGSILSLSIALILFLIFVVSIKTRTLQDGSKIFLPLNKSYLYSSLSFNIFSWVLVSYAMFIYTSIFNYQRSVLFYGLIAIIVINLLLFIGNITCIFHRFNFCPSGMEYNAQVKTCVKICPQNQIIDLQTFQCVEGCYSDSDCSNDKHCVKLNPDESIGFCCPNSSIVCGSNQCCDPNSCFDNICCASKERITKDGKCCPPNFKVVDGNCLGLCPVNSDNTFDPETEKCSMVSGTSKAMQNIYDSNCSDSSSKCVLKDNGDGTSILYRVVPLTSSCVKSPGGDFSVPNEQDNFTSLFRTNRIPDGYQYCTSGGKNYWSNQSECIGQTLKSVFDADENVMQELFQSAQDDTTIYGIFCGNQPDLSLIKSVNLVKRDENGICDAGNGYNICLSPDNAYADSTNTIYNSQTGRCLNIIQPNVSTKSLHLKDEYSVNTTAQDFYYETIPDKPFPKFKSPVSPQTIKNDDPKQDYLNYFNGMYQQCPTENSYFIDHCKGDDNADCCPLKDASNYICGVSSDQYGYMKAYRSPTYNCEKHSCVEVQYPETGQYNDLDTCKNECECVYGEVDSSGNCKCTSKCATGDRCEVTHKGTCTSYKSGGTVEEPVCSISSNDCGSCGNPYADAISGKCKICQCLK